MTTVKALEERPGPALERLGHALYAAWAWTWARASALGHRFVLLQHGAGLYGHDGGDYGVDDRKKEYAAHFWFGASDRARFTLDVIRCIPLCTSIYLAVFTLVYVPLLYREDRAAMGSWFGDVWTVLVLVVAYSPVFLLQMKLPSVIEDFAVAAHIAELTNFRYVEQVLSHRKTCTAFQALRVLATLRHPELVRDIMRRKDRLLVSRSSSWDDEDLDDLFFPDDDDLGARDGESEDEHLERLIALESLERRRRLTWVRHFLSLTD